MGRLDDRLAALAARVDAEARALLQPTAPAFAPLYDYMAYHLGYVDADLRPLAEPAAGGKKLRSALCLLVAGACSGRAEDALAPAVALDLVHNFSLVHDDVQDQSRLRRHRETVWARWGVAQAINVGDALFVLAQLALLRLGRGRPPDVVATGLDVLNDACLRLVEGQYLDLELQARAGVSFDLYEAMIARKTAALFAAAARTGALFAGAPGEQQLAWEELGRQLGLAFQLQDDLLGVWGRPEVTGKPSGADVYARKMALPAVLALGRHDGPADPWLRDFYASTGPADAATVAEVIRAFERAGVRERAAELVRDRFQRARAALDRADGSGVDRELIVELIDRMERREA